MKKLLVLFAAALTALGLMACAQDTDTPPPDTGGETAAVLVSGGRSEYTVVTTAATKAAGEDFAAAFETLSGVRLDCKTATSRLPDKCIAVGVPGSSVPLDRYSGWAIARQRDRLLVFAESPDGYGAALTAFIEQIEDICDFDRENSEMKLKSSVLVQGSTLAVFAGVPKGDLNATEYIDTGDGAYTAYFAAAEESQYDGYLARLSAAGFTEYAANELNGNRYATYIDGTTTVNVQYAPAMGTMCLTAEPQTTLQGVAADNVYTPSVSSKFTQVTLSQASNGMSYCLRLADGRFLLIDGGAPQTDGLVANELLATLRAQSQGKPVIAAWLFTHPHEDHIGAFNDFVGRHRDQVEIQSVICNFPPDGQIALSDSPYMLDETRLDSLPVFRSVIDQYLPDTKIVKAHSGHRYYIANAVIDVFMTIEDMYPQTCADFTVNATSMMFAIEIEGQRIMITGDCAENESNVASRRFGSWLKSDILQVVHHGINGATVELYSLFNPSVALWPSRMDWVEGNKLHDDNQWLINNDDCKEIMVAGVAQFSLTLPYTPRNTDMSDKFVTDNPDR